MANQLRLTRSSRSLVALAATALVLGCGSDDEFTFPLPEEPLETDVFDLVAGPIDRPAALNMVSARGNGLPQPVRVDQSDGWDVVFAVIDQEPVWLPRGYFQSFEPSSGVLPVPGSFESVISVPNDRELYEREQPVSIAVDSVYALISRPDPTLSFPCRILGKARVLSIVGDPAIASVEVFWNPNCDDGNVDSSN